MVALFDETEGIMITKRLFSLVCSIGVAAFIAASCQAPALEEIQGLEGQETEVVPEWTTIPYSLKVTTEKTRVATDQDAAEYQFKEGDMIRVTGTGDRTDIVGELTKDTDDGLWKGELTYLTANGLTSGETLEVTLIHADNADASTYSSALVGTGAIEGCVTEGQLLQYAVEHYSLFTATDTYRGQNAAPPSTAVTLEQQATFLDVKVEFDFDGSHIIDAGEALVDLRTTKGETTIETRFFEKPETDGEDFYVHFMAIVPGNQPVSAFTLKVGDRLVEFSAANTEPLKSNYKYTVNRTITYHPKVGDPFWSDGTYGRLRHPSSQEKIVGIVVFVHDFKENMTADEIAIADAITEKREDENGKQLYGHGLVMALTNAAVDVPWSSSNGKIPCTTPYVTDPEHTLAVTTLSGYANTESIRSALTNANAYSGSAAYLAENYTYNGVSVSTTSTTGWFLPSVGQWMYTISEDGFGEADPASQWVNGNGVSWLKNGYSNDGNLGDLVFVKECSGEDVNVLVKSLNDRLEQFKNEFEVTYAPFGDPSRENNVSDNYWTSSEKDRNNAIRMNFGTVKKMGGAYYSTIKVKGEDKEKVTVYTENSVNYKMKVRPFLAF